MTVTVEKSMASGKITAPPSKSMAHRSLICAALSEGESRIFNIDYSNDIKATVNCLTEMGAVIKKTGNGVSVRGIDFKKAPKAPLDCLESGSTLRFLIPICLGFDYPVTLKGTEKLFSRSLGVYEQIFKKCGVDYNITSDSITLNGNLGGGEYRVSGKISSQFISGLLFALPTKETDSTIVITDKLESAPYVDMTIEVLRRFGIEIQKSGNEKYFIKGGQKYKATDYTVEGDYSNAAFLDALNLLGSSVEVCGLSNGSLQGDRVYKQYFDRLNSGFSKISISDCPDLALILMAVAAEKHGAEFVGTERLKIKESDRGNAMAEELSKFGAEVSVENDRIIVKKSTLHSPDLPINSHNDHRIVMAAAVLLTKYGGTIENSEAVNKSFPDFFEKLQQLGIKVKKECL